ncbi:WXG100 family type VII secretion target [Saccharopolyspora dendranthemae]|uniref:Outer membrane channel protein CpnT-like N-terminal domain-containing protein n=1 Tax=Saccharopolyspora dendranthemae TaxID=1181886 RepID=A0A561VBB2_9PSEU|nr:WXG100 family type VII secretion target [Saccharopolyspora dendranthemae]TWG08906.1 hypothetical protein FHU35_111535 [Saccharopolyspora dendranthemae]
MVVTDSEAEADAVAKNTKNPMDGAGGVENVVSIYKGIENGDWDTVGLSAVGVGVDAVSLATNPLGTLASWGVGYIMEHVEFIKEPFDALMGNPDAISGMASTWGKIGEELKSVGQEYAQTVRNTTGWEGKAAEAYRNLGDGGAKTIDALATASTGLKASVDGVGALVSAVRGIVRDLIAGAIGEIIAALAKWGIAAVCTAGVAIGGAIADAVRIALQWAEKISGWMQKLGTAMKNMWNKLDELGTAATSIRKGVDEFFSGLSTPPEGNLLKLQNKDTPLTAGKVDELAEGATGSGSKLKDAWEGTKAGGSGYQPFAKGDVWQPSMSMGPGAGSYKGAYELDKESAKLDDGNEQEGK